jgi:hypothetical protein
MKKYLRIMCIAIFTFSLIACGKQEKEAVSVQTPIPVDESEVTQSPKSDSDVQATPTGVEYNVDVKLDGEERDTRKVKYDNGILLPKSEIIQVNDCGNSGEEKILELSNETIKRLVEAIENAKIIPYEEALSEEIVKGDSWFSHVLRIVFKNEEGEILDISLNTQEDFQEGTVMVGWTGGDNDIVGKSGCALESADLYEMLVEYGIEYK